MIGFYNLLKVRAVAQVGARHVEHMQVCSKGMSKMIQIRNVPDKLHRKLKVRAATAGLSLSDYLLNELQLLASRPSMEELRDRLAERRAVRPKLSPADAVREERERR